MLGEISQKKKSKYHIISLLCGILKKRKKLNQNKPTAELTDSENRLVAARSHGRGMGKQYKLPVIQ